MAECIIRSESDSHEDESDSEDEPIAIGSKAYWDTVYQRDLNNFQDNGDFGDVWFGYSNLRHITRFISTTIKPEEPIIDLGCGNGMLLNELWKLGFKNLAGVDYCEDAVQLSIALAKIKGCQAEFFVGDLLDWKGPRNRYKVAIDKGTYDTISLDPDEPAAKRRNYLRTIPKLLQPNGYFVISSCNWTESELRDHISQGLTFSVKLPSPTYLYGGSTGTLVTTMIYVKA